MADKKITDLQQVSAITDDLNFPVDDTLQTYRGTIGQVKNYLAPIYIAPSKQIFTSGSGTYNLGHAFIVSSANATVGATYTNNGNTYTVLKTVATSSLVWMSGSAAPTNSGTLTKASGTGDSAITFSAYRKALYIRVRMTGAGGGGGASGTTGSPTAGGTGGNTTFGTTLLVANGGIGATHGTGAAGGFGGAGGTASLGSGPYGIALTGAAGGSSNVTSGSQGQPGPCGASSHFMGGGGGGGGGASGTSAPTNSGAGGGGAGGPTGSAAGGGGGAGGFVDATISDPSFTYSYAVGGGGSAGSAGGGNGGSGGAGGSGLIEVTEYYQ